jgi:hypothetical protein
MRLASPSWRGIRDGLQRGRHEPMTNIAPGRELVPTKASGSKPPTVATSARMSKMREQVEAQRDEIAGLKSAMAIMEDKLGVDATN